MSFSWDAAKKQAIDTKIKRAIIMAKGNINSDFDVLHPDWIKQAVTKDYIDLKLKIKEKVVRKQDKAIIRRAKLAPK